MSKLQSLDDLRVKDRKKEITINLPDGGEKEVTIYAVPYSKTKTHWEAFREKSLAIQKEKMSEIQFNTTRDGRANINDPVARQKMIQAQDDIDKEKENLLEPIHCVLFYYGFLEPNGLAEDIDIEVSVDEDPDTWIGWLNDEMLNGVWHVIARRIAQFSTIKDEDVFFSQANSSPLKL